MESIQKKIKETLLKIKRGVLLFPEDVNTFGSSETVRLALHRLEKQGIITRIAQGIYVRPVISDYIGEVLPSAEEVALGIPKEIKSKLFRQAFTH